MGYRRRRLSRGTDYDRTPGQPGRASSSESCLTASRSVRRPDASFNAAGTGPSPQAACVLPPIPCSWLDERPPARGALRFDMRWYGRARGIRRLASRLKSTARDQYRQQWQLQRLPQPYAYVARVNVPHTLLARQGAHAGISPAGTSASQPVRDTAYPGSAGRRFHELTMTRSCMARSATFAMM